MLKKIIFFFLFFLMLNLNCSKNDDTVAPTNDCIRVGAVCNDGTTSTATVSGACSHHGGVNHWICK